MGGVSSAGSITGATSTWQSQAQDAAIAYAEGDPILGQQMGQLSTVAQSTMELLDKLSPPESQFGRNVDVRA